jgi:hypothetical protein
MVAQASACELANLHRINNFARGFLESIGPGLRRGFIRVRNFRPGWPERANNKMFDFQVPPAHELAAEFLQSRRVSLAGITRHPDQPWMQQMARNATGEAWGFLDQRCYALHDRDTKFCAVFRATLAAGGIEPIQLPARSPNLNAYAERWVRSVKGECLSKLILFGEASLRRALTDFVDHFHGERNHQGKGNVLLFPSEKVGQQKPRSRVRCRQRLGGLLRYYSYAA